MEDENRSAGRPPEQPPAEDEPGHEPDTQRRPPSRLERLMRAQEEAQREAASEEPAAPPDADPAPFIQEPPRTEQDTPTGQDTPPEGLPRIERLSQPPFPHPTDPPQSSAPSPPEESTSPPNLGVEPPLPGETLIHAPVTRPAGSTQPPSEEQTPPPPAPPTPTNDPLMPLIQPVDQEDMDATLVGRSAYYGESADDAYTLPSRAQQPDSTIGGEQPTMPSRARIPVDRTPPPQPTVQAPATPPPRTRRAPQRSATPPRPPRRPTSNRKAKPRRKPRRRRKLRLSWGCVTRTLMLIIAGGIVALMLGGGGMAIYYSQVTAPSFRGISEIEDLQDKALQFQTTRIRDREGNILYEINDPEGGFRDYVSLDEVSPWVIVATVATEERDYFTNPGFSIPGIARALVQNYREGEVVSGASTITQQLTRALLLPEEERAQRTYSRKIKEIFLAAELGRRFDKKEILELYLNQVYYGNLAYGIEAAAQTYFDKSAADLNLAEASFLAGLGQAPAIYDPVTSRELALGRQQQVLALMLEAGCIDVGRTDLQLPCTTREGIDEAYPELLAVATREYVPPTFQTKYPHWVVYVQQLLEADPTIGPAIYTSGFDVYTTLDPRLQELAQDQVDAALAELQGRNVTNASVIVEDVNTGALLAMVGSRDFNDESISGQVNIALTPQQPGSSIKPFTYLAAFRQGWNPATVIWDVPIAYEIPGFGTYEPVNYSGRANGPVTVRYAIANSLNVPAVITLDHVGVPALLEVLNDVGVESLGDPSNPNEYGLSLTLGAGEVTLLEWTNAYATIANGGRLRPTYAIERVERDGVPVEGYPYQPPEGEQVLDPGQVYLMQNILSDTEARIPSFGQNTPLSPPYPAGAKTGTTNDFRDNWTMGFTTEVAVGVWVGNTDNSEMINVTGVTGAGPIWRGVMDGAAEWYPPQEFQQPASVFPQTVCRDDGTLAADYQFCLEHSDTITELFVQDPPGADARIYRELTIDQYSGLIANEYCNSNTAEEFFLDLPNQSQLIDLRPFIRNWLTTTDMGQQWLTTRSLDPALNAQEPPTEACSPDTPQPTIAITEPAEGSVQENIVTVIGTANAPNFSHYRVEFGVSNDPIAWGVVQGDTSQPIENAPLGQIDLSGYDDGPMTIRVIVYGQDGQTAEARVHFTLQKTQPSDDDS